MEYRQVGRSGLKVSQVGLGSGSATFSGRADDRLALEIIERAFDLGITYFDTAETYAEGRAETLLGKALKKKRSDVVIGTKFGKSRSVGDDEQRGSRRRIMRAVEGSLNRLDTDYIDVYILHQPDPVTPIDETLRALDDLVRAGKVRYIACADLAAWQVCEAVWTSRSQNLESFVSAGADYNMLCRGIEKDLVPFCEAYGVGIVPTAPLAGGFLTGKYRRGQALPDDSRFGSPPPFAGAKFQDLGRYDRVLSETNFDRLDRLESFARDHGHTTTELALAWLLSRPCLAMVPIGVTTVAQLEADVSGLGWRLSDDELIEIDGILQSGL